MQLSPEVLLSIIRLLLCCIGGLLAFFAALIGILHKGMTRRLDIIELDLKPMAGQILMHTEQIGELKEDNKEIHKRLNHYDGRIQKVESTLRQGS